VRVTLKDCTEHGMFRDYLTVREQQMATMTGQYFDPTESPIQQLRDKIDKWLYDTTPPFDREDTPVTSDDKGKWIRHDYATHINYAAPTASSKCGPFYATSC
jgi:hypothetical protein